MKETLGMTRTRTGAAVAAIAALLIVVAVGWAVARRAAADRAAADPSSAAASVSALVQTERLSRQSLPIDLVAYGEVLTGRIEAVGFARAGQVAQLRVTPGQRVRKGATLATLASDPASRLAYSQAANAVRFAQSELQRTERLLALQLATRSQVDAAGRQLQDAQASLDAQIELGGNLGSATVLAPFDGVVTSIAVAQGDRVQPGASLLQLGHVDAMQVQLGIEPDDSRLVRPGMTVDVRPLDAGAQSVPATLTQIQGLVDARTRLVMAVAALPAHTSTLVPGMRVRVTIHVGRREAWVVPRQAVLADAQGDHVFQVAGGKARRVAVTQQQQTGEQVAIDGALDAALPLVVLGNYELQDGMRVREQVQQQERAR